MVGDHMKNKGKKMTQSFTYGKPHSLKAFTWHKKNSNVLTCEMGLIIKGM
jgi:hypothetical protein